MQANPGRSREPTVVTEGMVNTEEKETMAKAQEMLTEAKEIQDMIGARQKEVAMSLIAASLEALTRYAKAKGKIRPWHKR